MDEQKKPEMIPGIEKAQAIVTEATKERTQALIMLEMDFQGNIRMFQYGNKWDTIQICNMYTFNETAAMLGLARAKVAPGSKPAEEAK